MFDYTYRLLKKVIKKEMSNARVELYNNQLKHYDGTEMVHPVVLVDFKKTDYDFSTKKPKNIETDFSLFIVSKMSEDSSSKHLEMMDSINTRLYEINETDTFSDTSYHYSTLLGEKSSAKGSLKNAGEIVVSKLYFDGEIDTARTKDFAYDNLRINALNYKAIMHFIPNHKKGHLEFGKPVEMQKGSKVNMELKFVENADKGK